MLQFNAWLPLPLLHASPVHVSCAGEIVGKGVFYILTQFLFYNFQYFCILDEQETGTSAQ